nr:retrovirus-related Pol polyprotein from transposon TNT 1-94 [Tanacetum cinerariifolium]
MTVNVEDTSSKAMVAIDGAGFDWSYMDDDEALTNMAFMALLDSKAQSLDKLIGSQITDNSKSGLGYVSYNVVPPLHTGRFSPPRIDCPTLAYQSLLSQESDKEDEVEYPPEKERKNVKPSVHKARCKYYQRERMVNGTNHSRVNHNATKVPKAMLTRIGLKPVNFVRPVNPKRNFFKKINTAKEKVNTARPNSTVLNVVRANKGKVGHSHKQIKDQGYFDSGCSRHITDPTSLTSKSLMEDMLHLGDELKVMCDKKNNVLFTGTEYFVLSHDFKLADESHVLLKVPRKNNMYSVDIKNIVPKKDLTCLVSKATNDESMLWHRRLTTKDETNRILKSFITEIENLVDKKVKIIRCDNGTEFKNRFVNEFCEEKCIKREYSVARTPQQNRVADRRNRTLIEAARTRLADSKLPITFWAEAVNTACYVQNRVLVVKPHFKTPYELFRGRTSALSFMRPFGCHVTIINTLEHLGKFDGKSDEGFFVGYSTNSKAFRVYNTRTRKVEEKLHIKFLENKPLITRDGTKWLFDIDTLTESMNCVPVSALNTDRLSDDYFGANNDMRSLDRVELDIRNLSTTYHVPTTLNTRINKDYSLDNVIGDMQSGVQTRRMTVTTDEQGTQKDYQCTKRSSMVEAMQEELLQFHLQKVWKLVDLPRGKRAIGIKYVLRNKKDERGIVIRNKARLVAQGCTQEEGIDYDEVFAPVARIEAIRLFLAYASFMGFLVYQMDVKSAFLYGRTEEEVYMCQPPGFEDLEYTDKVYKVKKALYGVHQAPKARQDKYVDEILRKFKYEDVKPARTSMDKEKALLKDSDGDDVDVHLYRTLDNGEMELNATIDGQVKTITEASVRRHLKLADANGISSLPITEIFEQLALMRGFSGVETTLFPTMLVTEQVSHGEGPTSPVGTQHTPTIIESSPHLQNISITYRKNRTRTGRMGIRVPQSNVPSRVANEAIIKEVYIGLGKATTTASSLAAEQGSGNISKTQTKATPSGPSSLRTSSEGGLGCHFTMGDSPVQARPERLSNLPSEPPLEKEKITSLKNELTSTKAVYNKALITLTKRVKKLEKQLKHKRKRAVIDSSDDAEPSLDAEDSLKQGRMIEELDKDENVNLVQSSEQGEAQETAKRRMEFSTASPQTTNDETLTETLLNIKRSATKDKGKCIMQEPELLKKIKEREMIQPIFERVWDQNHTFLPMDYKTEKEVMKRSGFDLQQESSKKQKLDEQAEVQVDSDQEEDEMKKYMKIVPGEEIAIDAIPLATKPPNIDREDLETLWKLVKAKYGDTRPYEAYERVLWGDLKVMFEPDIESEFPLNYESEPGYIENYNSYPYDSSSLPQQYPCCTRCGGPHETCQCDQLIFNEPYCKYYGGPHMNFQCQPMNHDSYNSNSLGFDQPQPPQSLVIHQPPQELSIQEMEDLKQQYLDELKPLSNLKYHDEIKIAELTENFIDEVIKSGVKNLIPIPSESKGIPEHMCDVPSHDNSLSIDVSKDQFEDLSESNEEFSSTDDDSFSFDKIDYVEASPPDSELVSSEVIEIVIPKVGGIDADILLTIKDDILFISGTPLTLTPSGETDFFLETKSSSTSLNSLLEETNNFDNSLPEFTTFSKVLFAVEYESDSSDDQSCSDEDVLEKIVLKPLFEEEIIPMKIDQHPDNAKSAMMESLRTHDSSLLISSKIDSLLDEFAGELTLFKSISPGINETDCDFEEDIRLIEKLLYDNSSPRPSEEFVSANSDAKIKSFSPSPILVKDSDSLMEEIDLFCTLDYPMPPGIEDEDYDSERDILIRKDLPSNNTLSFAEKESFHFDILSFSRPPAKPPDGDTRILNIKMMGDIYGQKAFMHKLMITFAPH